ncbi:hypothetical protein E1200_08420 [Actinomadura sp. GC306]|uniref:hypothetical protein n=1 Tax=Actinomadura sp. GC306 TaxID=2530367 RepID=UPI00104B3765|nr:hypothetical protein [Actinomadura sp. GC306]TDC69478.1 hypothetical protein E1200_08420 [Actinomadura sp. GC306]
MPPTRAARFAPVAACAVLLAVAGCSGDGRGGGTAPPGTAPASAAPAAAGPSGPDGAPGCRPASPVAPYEGDGLPEIRATGHGIRASGLLMSATGHPVRADQELKIVWRVTGDGPLRAAATGPDGREREPAWGPEPHGGSSFQRPGSEWGVGYRIDEPGCWRLRLARGTGTADAWLRVAG